MILYLSGQGRRRHKILHFFLFLIKYLQTVIDRHPILQLVNITKEPSVFVFTVLDHLIRISDLDTLHTLLQIAKRL